MKDLYTRDTENATGLRLLPKLKYEHVNLTSFSKMRVDLAAQVSNSVSRDVCQSCMWIIAVLNMQVLSESVAKALKLTEGDDVEETVRFTTMMDKFFDCMNVNNFSSGVKRGNDFNNLTDLRMTSV